MIFLILMIKKFSIFLGKKNILTDIRKKKKIEGVMLRSRSRYQDLGEKPSKYFFNLENRNFVNKTMNKIIESDGTEYSETKEILKCQQKFYENFYSDISNDVDGNPIEDIAGENENKLSHDESQKLEGDIKLGELSNSLKNMKNFKSPGLDGFTVEFFKNFLDRFKIFYSKIIKLWVSYRISLRHTKARYHHMPP